MAQRLPVEEMKLIDSAWGKVGGTVSAGRALSGLSQAVTTTGGGARRAELSFLIRTEEDARRFRAYLDRMDDGSEPIEIPYKGLGGKVPLTTPISTELITFSNGATFENGAKFQISPVVPATIAASAALRATQIDVRFADPVTIFGGELFSIVHPTGVRLYSIHSIVSQSGSDYTLKIRPPLREAVTTATEIDFDDPRCLMRLQDESFSVLGLTGLRRASPRLAFIEHLEPQAAS